MVNQRIADMLGYTRDELVGMSWRELTHPDDLAVSAKLVEQLTQGDRAPAVLEKRYLHKSGRTVWAALTARSIVDASTGERIAIALVQDVSPQRRSEELTRALSEQTSRLAAIIQKTPLAVILTNEDGEMTYFNSAALEMLGISEGIGALGQPVELIDAGVDGHTATLLDDVGQDGRWSGERYFRSIGSGEVLPVHVTAFRLETPPSGVGSFAFIAKDIRERKQIESALRERERRLRYLAQRLIRAQEEERSRIARELHDDVTQRLAMIAVELGLLQSELGAQPKEALARIRDEVAGLSNAVRDLSHQYHPSVLAHSNLETALESLCCEFEHQHGIQARFRSRADTSGVARPIATAVYRIIQEALRNVARHSGAERVVLTVDCDENELKVALLDDGRGFDPEAVPGRRGLGLTSMKERAVAIGGSIELHSEPGCGVRIELTAPVAEGCEEDSADES